MRLKILHKKIGRKYIKTEQEITKRPTDDSKIKYVCSDLMKKKKKIVDK